MIKGYKKGGILYRRPYKRSRERDKNRNGIIHNIRSMGIQSRREGNIIYRDDMRIFTLSISPKCNPRQGREE